jgi:hypothetical protein
MHYIIKYPDGEYQYARRRTGRYMYECRTMFGPNINEARVYTSKSAAKNSMVHSDGQILEVTLGLVEA